MKRSRPLSLLALALAAAPVPGIAQSVADMGLPDTPKSDGAANNRPEGPDAEARRKALNQEQAQAAQAQVEDFNARQRAREATIATETARQEREQAAFGEAVRQHETAVRDYEAARAQWEASNPYCKRNDPVKCPR